MGVVFRHITIHLYWSPAQKQIKWLSIFKFNYSIFSGIERFFFHLFFIRRITKNFSFNEVMTFFNICPIKLLSIIKKRDRRFSVAIKVMKQNQIILMHCIAFPLTTNVFLNEHFVRCLTFGVFVLVSYLTIECPSG